MYKTNGDGLRWFGPATRKYECDDEEVRAMRDTNVERREMEDK